MNFGCARAVCGGLTARATCCVPAKTKCRAAARRACRLWRSRGSAWLRLSSRLRQGTSRCSSRAVTSSGYSPAFPKVPAAGIIFSFMMRMGRRNPSKWAHAAMWTLSGRARLRANLANRTSRTPATGSAHDLCRRALLCRELFLHADQPGGLALAGQHHACGLDLGATGFLTTYVHDPLGNLTKVNQGAESRSYQFDALSRLTQSTDPESGVTAYTYGSDSNVATRIRPRANQTSAGVTTTTTYQWDELGRLLNSSYSDGTPSRTFAYDQATGFSGAALSNPVGRMTYADVPGFAETFSYTQTGQVSANWQANTAAVYHMDYGYDLAGDMLTQSNPDIGSFTLSTTYNLAQRPVSLSSSLVDAHHSASLASGAQYNALGEPVTVAMGNGITETTAFDNRGRMTGRQAGTVYQLSGIQYEPDVNVWNVPTESVMG